MATATSRPRGDASIPAVAPEEALADEETVEEFIEEAAVVLEEEPGFEEEILPRAAGEREGLDWFTPEDLEEEQEGIGPPLEEELHDVDRLHEAILDEGELLTGYANNEVQEAVEEEEEEEEEELNPQGRGGGSSGHRGT